MATYNFNSRINSIENTKDLEKIREYLFQNNELLRYMFNNLTPEDNYSSDALKKYYERDEKIATLEFDTSGLKVNLKDLKTETEANLEVLNKSIKLKVSVGDVSNQLSVETGGINISGQRLTISTNNLTLTKDGTLKCKNGTFAGTITSTQISTSKFNGGTITGATIRAGKNWDVSNDTCYMLYADDENVNIGNFHVVEYGGRYIIESDDSWVGMSPELPDGKKSGRVSLWANYHPDQSEDYDFSVSQNGNTRLKNLTIYNKVYDDFVLGTLEEEYSDYSSVWHKVGYNIIRLWHRYSALEERVSDLEDSI